MFFILYGILYIVLFIFSFYFRGEGVKEIGSLFEKGLSIVVRFFFEGLLWFNNLYNSKFFG